MFLYESLIKSKYYKDITHEFIQREYNDNIELENKLNNRLKELELKIN